MPDMIAARQELDLRPQLERLDRLICWSEDIDEEALAFAFRSLWQLDEPAKAALALSKAQATQVYAGLKLWPDAVMAKLAEAQLVADGTYPNAAAVFAEQAGEVVKDAREVGAVPRASGGSWPGEGEPRDWHGRWTTGSEGGAGALVGSAPHAASPVQGQQLAGPLPVPNTPADPSAAGQELHAPDGTPVELASSRGRARALARMLGALAAAARSIRRWLPEEPDEPEPSSGPDVTLQAPSTPPPQSSPPIVQPPKLTIQDLARVTRGFAGRKSARKWLNQMNDRGWTPEQIEEAIRSGGRIPESQRVDPTHGATRYVHPRTGRSVTIDDVTGQVIQLGGDGFDY